MLRSVQTLQSLGFNLYGSKGTADYFQVERTLKILDIEHSSMCTNLSFDEHSDFSRTTFMSNRLNGHLTRESRTRRRVPAQGIYFSNFFYEVRNFQDSDGIFRGEEIPVGHQSADQGQGSLQGVCVQVINQFYTKPISRDHFYS